MIRESLKRFDISIFDARFRSVPKETEKKLIQALVSFLQESEQVLNEFEFADLEDRHIDPMVDEYLDKLEHKSPALVGLRSIGLNLIPSNDFKRCLLEALSHPDILNGKSGDRLVGIYRSLAHGQLLNTGKNLHKFEYLFDLAVIIRKTTGANIFRTNDCLFQLSNLSELKKQIFISGEIFVYISIAESQKIFQFKSFEEETD